jgi:type IV pilus assembly protein PilN
MVRINLLSQTEKKKKGGAIGAPSLPRLSGGKGFPVPLPLLGGVFLLLLLAGAVFLYFNQNSRLASLEERIDVAKQDSTRYSRAIGKMREIESSQAAIAARIQAIQEVDQGRFRWAHIMEELSRSLPEYTWLTSVVRREDVVEENQIEITGITFSNLTLTQFMTNLESSPYLERISLIGSNRSNVEGVDVTSFALVAAYTQPPAS